MDGSEPKPGWQNQNIWMVSRDEAGKWGDPTPLPGNINAGAQFFPSVSNTGDMYFCRTDSARNSAIYHTTWPLDEDHLPTMLPAPVNGSGSIFNACISPDGGCLVGCVTGREPEINERWAIYYAFFKIDDDDWSEGFRLDSILQIHGANAISPAFSPDGKFFFFATTKKRSETYFAHGNMTLDYFQERRNLPGNGNSDIYWVDARVILDLKP
jgi:hypothetical protein